MSWNAVAGASGYRIHAGPVSGLYTHVSADIASPTVTGSVTVPTTGTWYVAVAAYDANGYEGEYSAEQTKIVTGSQPPIGAPELAVR